MISKGKFYRLKDDTVVKVISVNYIDRIIECGTPNNNEFIWNVREESFDKIVCEEIVQEKQYA